MCYENTGHVFEVVRSDLSARDNKGRRQNCLEQGSLLPQQSQNEGTSESTIVALSSSLSNLDSGRLQ